MASKKLLSLGDNQSMFNFYRCAQRLPAFDMLVDGPAADIAAARQRYFRAFIFSEQCPYQIIGSPDLLYIVICDHKIADP